jgi:hypothetical protein
MRLEPGDSILYMKIGMHAQEDLTDILARKRREIEDEGFAMWGYGGNTCHPTSRVQPFAKSATGPIVLCMQPMQSRHSAEPIRAEEFSVDGIHWKEVPSGINVLGSKYALCIRSLEEVDDTLDLAYTKVAMGAMQGLTGDRYVRGRVDKACLEIIGLEKERVQAVHIGAVAEIIEPYAVLLRN